MLLKNRTCWELVIDRFQVQCTWKKQILITCVLLVEQMEKKMLWFCFGQFYNTKEHGDTVCVFKIWKRTEIFAVWTESRRSVNADESVFTCQAFWASVHLTTWGHHYPNLSSSCHCVRFVSSPSSDKWLRAKCRACQYVSMAMEFAELGEDGL